MDYKLKKVGSKNVLELNLIGAAFPPVLEESEACMEQVITAIRKIRRVDRVVLLERRIREYDEQQTALLVGVANAVEKLVFSERDVRPPYSPIGADWVEFVKKIPRAFMRDPIGTFTEVRREKTWQEIEQEREIYPQYVILRKKYLKVLNQLLEVMGALQLIKLVEPLLEGYKVGDRTIYRKVFRSSVRPNFTYTKLLTQYPTGEEIDSYRVGDSEVTIIQRPNNVRLFYHLIPPEFKLSEVEYELIERIKETLMAYKPKSEDLIDPDSIRDAVKNIAVDMVKEDMESRRIKLDVQKLAGIITRETVGFGILEILLKDDKVQDITINAPLVNPIFVYHADAEDCETNIYPTIEETQAWAARLRLMSGRPLDESNP
ncbi:MAG: hypothetical protein GOV00_03330, partial [Candidatus Altiarchaeota archaeon]|nr:hypothetical protein [Candidatus Altiarchaeota archaeon]